MKTQILNIDPDNIESVDKFINEVILSGESLYISHPLLPGKTTLTMILWATVLARLEQRQLITKRYRNKTISSLEADIIQYTGEPIQQEAIKQLFPDRKFYFCYDPNTKKDFLFTPGFPISISAYPGQYLVMTRAGGFSSISEKDFENNWVEIINE